MQIMLATIRWYNRSQKTALQTTIISAWHGHKIM